jgi:hypothetical protein
MERIRRVSLELCNPNDRAGVRFIGPRKRRFSQMLTIENLEGADMGQLCERVKPAVVFLRLTTGADAALGSRLDVYVPSGTAMVVGALSQAAYALSAGALALAVGILAHRA